MKVFVDPFLFWWKSNTFAFDGKEFLPATNAHTIQMHAVLFSISRNKWSIYQKISSPLQPKKTSSNSNASKGFIWLLRIHGKKPNLLLPPSRSSKSPPCAGFFAIFLVLLTAALRRGAKQGRLPFIGQTSTLWWKMAIATPLKGV